MAPAPQELAGRLAAEGASRADVDQQLRYQVGITEEWLQLRHMLRAFKGVAGAEVASAMLKHLAGACVCVCVAPYHGATDMHRQCRTIRLMSCPLPISISRFVVDDNLLDS